MIVVLAGLQSIPFEDYSVSGCHSSLDGTAVNDEARPFEWSDEARFILDNVRSR